MTVDDAVRLWQADRRAEAEAACAAILEKDPKDAGCLYLLGRFALVERRLDQALAFVDQAVALVPTAALYHFSRGIILRELGRSEEALLAYDETLRCAPDNVDAEVNRGAILLERGRLDEALAAFNHALQLQPDGEAAQLNRAVTLMQLGRLGAALGACDDALALNPGWAAARIQKGVVLGRLGRSEEALVAFAEVLRIQPESAEAHNNRGVVLSVEGRVREAYAAHAEAVRLKPDYVDALINLGDVLKELGRFDEAASAFGRVLQRRPDLSIAESARLFCLNLDPGCDDAALFEEHRAWGERRRRPRPPIESYPNAPVPDRPLRIGLVSNEFKAGAVGFLLPSMLAAADRRKLQFFCYAEGFQEDDLTARIRAQAAAWRWTTGLPGAAVAAGIREDGIDILICLNGHTHPRAMLMFASKPAPVQVNWLGYPCTTGLEAIDYALMDEAAVPHGEEHRFVEEVVRLPDTRFCYEPPDYAPTPAPPPLLERGYVTFGSFNKLSKVSAEVLRLWARVLEAIPGSRLLLKWKTLAEPEERARYRRLLGGLGIESGRIELRAKSPHDRMLAEYADVDIALDPCPYSGGITSLEALWQGVPVVTLAGTRPVARQTVGFLRVLGMDDLIATTPDDYVRIAADVGRDPARLAAMRQGQRERMAASALCDGERFALVLEQTLQALWRRWCEARAMAGAQVSSHSAVA